MSVDIVNSTYEDIEGLVKWFLGRTPELVALTKKTGKKQVEKTMNAVAYFLAREVNKSRNRTDYFIEHAILNSEYGKAVNQWFDTAAEAQNIVIYDRKMDFKFYCKVHALIGLHRCLSREELANRLLQMFHQEDGEVAHNGSLLALLWMEDQNLLEMTSKGYYKSMYALSKLDGLYLDLFQNLLPTPVKPGKVHLTKGGVLANGSVYHKTEETKPVFNDVWSKKVQLKHTEIPTEFLDIQNKYPYGLNRFMYNLWIKNHWEVPKREEKESDSDYHKKYRDALRLQKRRYFVIRLFEELNINTFYILNFFDYRGRNYPFAYLFSPQGRDSDKALLMHKPVPVPRNKELAAIKWLSISISSCYNCEYKGKDLDKHPFEVALEWFQQTISPLMELDKQSFLTEIVKMAPKAESPACFLSQCHNLWHIFRAIKKGVTPYVWVICHFDATCSGYQFMSIFTGDEDVAKATNVIASGIDKDHPTGLRSDFYSIAGKELGECGLPVEQYSRFYLKKYLWIPTGYGSVAAVKEAFPNREHRKIAKEYMATKKVFSLSKIFTGIWNSCSASYGWYLPDGFHVQQISETIKTVPVEVNDVRINIHLHCPEMKEYSCELLPNVVHSVDGFVTREAAYSCSWSQSKMDFIKKLIKTPGMWKFDPKHPSCARMKTLLECGKKFNNYSFLILHCLTPENIHMVPPMVIQSLMDQMCPNRFDISLIHDSFGILPQYAEEFLEQIRIIYAKIAESRGRGIAPIMEDLIHDEVVGWNNNTAEFCRNIRNSKYILR